MFVPILPILSVFLLLPVQLPIPGLYLEHGQVLLLPTVSVQVQMLTEVRLALSQIMHVSAVRLNHLLLQLIQYLRLLLLSLEIQQFVRVLLNLFLSEQ